jgi:hypothetical protein
MFLKCFYLCGVSVKIYKLDITQIVGSIVCTISSCTFSEIKHSSDEAQKYRIAEIFRGFSTDSNSESQKLSFTFTVCHHTIFRIHCMICQIVISIQTNILQKIIIKCKLSLSYDHEKFYTIKFSYAYVGINDDRKNYNVHNGMAFCGAIFMEIRQKAEGRRDMKILCINTTIFLYMRKCL